MRLTAQQKKNHKQALAYLRTGSPLGGKSVEQLVKEAADALDTRVPGLKGTGIAISCCHLAVERLLDALGEVNMSLGVTRHELHESDALEVASRKARNKLKKMSADEKRQTLVEAGIYTKEGQLTPAYGGPKKTAKSKKRVVR